MGAIIVSPPLAVENTIIERMAAAGDRQEKGDDL
jgi:hypothetical protein